MHTRKIPSTGELLPVVGCGTWQTFDVGALARRARAARRGAEGAVRGRRLGDRQLADVRPAEGVVGDLLAAAGTRDKAFLATKVWTQGRDDGIAQMEQSMRLLRTDHIDLMQIHNLVDWQRPPADPEAWKAEGRIRLIGITHYTEASTASSRRCCSPGGSTSCR